MSRDPAHLLDALNAAKTVREFMGLLSLAEFLADHKTQSAVVHQLVVLGEAVKRLSPETKAQNQKIPWKLIAGMRDMLIHEYDDVDLDAVWKTVTGDIPPLIEQLEKLTAK